MAFQCSARRFLSLARRTPMAHGALAPRTATAAGHPALAAASQFRAFSVSLPTNDGSRQKRDKVKKRPRGPNPNRKVRLELVLTKMVEGLGRKGDLVQVKRGFGRNWLIPQGLAAYATPANKAKYLAGEVLDAADEATEADILRNKLSSYIESKTVVVKRQQGNTWEVNKQMISDQALKQIKLEVPTERILLQNPLTTYGNFLVRLALSEDTVQNLKVSVVPR